MTRTWLIVALLLAIQPSALAWQDGKLTFPETAPVPSNIAKLLELKPRASLTYPLTLETGGIKVEAEPFIEGKPYQATITLTRNGVQTVIGNPRLSALYESNSSFTYFAAASAAAAFALSPDGRTLYVGSYGGGLRVIDLAQGKEVGLMLDPALAPYAVLAHHGGVTQLWTIQNPQNRDQWWLVSSARDATVKIWDGRTAKLISKAGYSTATNSAFSQTSTELFVAASNIVYRIAPLRAKMIEKFAGPTNIISAVAPLGESLWAKTTDGTVMSWSLETLQRQKMYSQILLAAVNADATRVAVKFGDNQIRYLRAADLAVIGTIAPSTKAFTDPIIKNQLRLSPRGTYLALTGLSEAHMIAETIYHDSMRVWNSQSGREQRGSYGAGVTTWSPDERFVASKASNSLGSLGVTSLETGQDVTPEMNSSIDIVSPMAWVNGQPQFVGITGLEQNSLVLRLYAGFKPTQPRLIGAIAIRPKPYTYAQIALSPDATRVALLLEDTLTLWDVKRGKRLATKKLEGRLIDSVYLPNDYVLRFSDDSESLLSWNEQAGEVWNAKTLADEGSADCKKEVLGFLKSPRAVICNDGDQLTMIPFTN